MTALVVGFALGLVLGGVIGGVVTGLMLATRDEYQRYHTR